MKYTGGKQQLSKYIAPIIEQYLDKYPGKYWEPFVGGGNMFVKVNNPVKIGSDVDKDVIALFNYMRDYDVEDLPYITRELYLDVKDNTEKYPDYMVGYVSICSSFQGKKWGGYAGAKSYKSAYRDYPLEALNNIKKQSKLISPLDKFLVTGYEGYQSFNPTVVYCDPPYQNTTGYKAGKFDHTKFWDWVREYPGIVLVSEYTAPNDFTSIWYKSKKSTTGLVKSSTRTENLFIHKSKL